MGDFAQPPDHFHISSFLLNVCAYIILVVVTIFIHHQFVIRSQVVTAYDFARKQKITISSFEGFYENISSVFWIIAMFTRDCQKFVNLYGFTIFNFLNFQVKGALVLFCVAVFSLVSGFIRFNLMEESFPLVNYLIGNYRFQNLVGLTTANAFFSVIAWSAYIFILHRESRRIHLKVFLHSHLSRTRISLIPHVVYLSHIPKHLSKAEVHEQFAKILNIPKSEFHVLLFPKTTKMHKLQYQIDITRNRLKTGELLYWRLFKRTPEKLAQLQQKIIQLRTQYREEMQAPFKYTSRGVICFHNLADLEKFYRWKVKERSVISIARKIVKSSTTELLVPTADDSVFRGMKKFFLFSFNDIIFRNLSVKLPAYFLVRFALYALLVLVLLFLTTPMALVQMILGKMHDAEKTSQLGKFVKDPTSKLIVTLGLPLVICLINLTLLILIDQIGRLQRFGRYSLLQGYVFRVSFVYLLINMFVIPGVSIGTAKSIFHMILTSEIDLNHLILNLKVYESSNVISLVILQSGAVGFFIILLSFSDAVLNLFNYRQMLKWYHKMRNKVYRKQEGDVFEFGYYYSYDTVILYLAIVFGIYQPLIIITGYIYFALKSAANIASLTHYYKEQIYSRCKFIDMALNRIKFALSLSFFVLALKCHVSGFKTYFVLNFSAFLALFILAFTIKIKSFDVDLLFQPMNYLKFSSLSRPQIYAEHSPKQKHSDSGLLLLLHGPNPAGQAHRTG
jgi:hypothetical protein